MKRHPWKIYLTGRQNNAAKFVPRDAARIRYYRWSYLHLLFHRFIYNRPVKQLQIYTLCKQSLCCSPTISRVTNVLVYRNKRYLDGLARHRRVRQLRHVVATATSQSAKANETSKRTRLTRMFHRVDLGPLPPLGSAENDVGRTTFLNMTWMAQDMLRRSNPCRLNCCYYPIKKKYFEVQFDKFMHALL